MPRHLAGVSYVIIPWARAFALEGRAARHFAFTIPNRLRIFFRFDRWLPGEC